VHQAENVAENLGVVGILLETHELDVDHVETFVRLGDKFPQQVVHEKRLDARRPYFALRQERGQCVVEAFNFGCGNPVARAALTVR
jgi:3-isopropylmalate dehydratase small subunit